jgi:hypothetical protein
MNWCNKGLNGGGRVDVVEPMGIDTGAWLETASRGANISCGVITGGSGVGSASRLSQSESYMPPIYCNFPLLFRKLSSMIMSL